MGGEEFKKEQFHSAALTNCNFVLLLESYIACLCTTMCSLVMRLFSHDFIKMNIDYLNYQQCFNLLNNGLHVCNSHNAWFLNGRTSKLVIVSLQLKLFLALAHAQVKTLLLVSMCHQ